MDNIPHYIYNKIWITQKVPLFQLKVNIKLWHEESGGGRLNITLEHMQKNNVKKYIPRVILPPTPSQVLVHPPHWYPRLSACVPETRIFLAFFSNGRNGIFESFPFFRSTIDFRTASRPSSRCNWPQANQLVLIEASRNTFSIKDMHEWTPFHVKDPLLLKERSSNIE